MEYGVRPFYHDVVSIALRRAPTPDDSFSLLVFHSLLRIQVIGGQSSVRIAPPSLPFHHSSPATRDFQCSISNEALLSQSISKVIFQAHLWGTQWKATQIVHALMHKYLL